MFQSVAGIDTNGPGYRRVLIHPLPGKVGEGLDWVKARYHSPQGPIASAWKKSAERFSLNVTIPANTTATVFVPAMRGDRVTESGRPVDQVQGVKLLRREASAAVYHVAAGEYRFVAEKP